MSVANILEPYVRFIFMGLAIILVVWQMSILLFIRNNNSRIQRVGLIITLILFIILGTVLLAWELQS